MLFAVFVSFDKQHFFLHFSRFSDFYPLCVSFHAVIRALLKQHFTVISRTFCIFASASCVAARIRASQDAAAAQCGALNIYAYLYIYFQTEKGRRSKPLRPGIIQLQTEVNR